MSINFDDVFQRVHTASDTAPVVPDDYLANSALKFMHTYAGVRSESKSWYHCHELRSADFISVFPDWRRALAKMNTYADPFGWEFVIATKMEIRQPEGRRIEVTHLVIRDKM